VPVWQRQEVQEVLREIDDFGPTLRRRKWMGRLMQGAGQIITLDKHSFRECLEKDEDLAWLRTEYAHKSAEKRRMAADWEYHSAIAGSMFNEVLARLGRAEFGVLSWPDGVLALAIDPLFAPAILTVGSVDLGWTLYQAGYLEEAEATLAKSVNLAPLEYESARKNLEEVRDVLAGNRVRGESDSA
jgi:hypothetical protein